MKGCAAALAALALWGSSIPAQTFTTLHSFPGSDGANPRGGLVLSGDTLYGTTVINGSGLQGTVFKVNTDGSGYATLHSFTGGGDGANPYAGLVLSGNTLYGTACNGGVVESGGINVPASGTVFKLNTDGTGFTVLHSFTAGDDGANPPGSLVLSGNTLYGTAQYGTGVSPAGTVFKLNTDGTGFTVLHSFTAGSDGANPFGSLVLSGNTLYGTTFHGGNLDDGTVFKLNTDGTGFTVLHSFTGIAGYYPLGRLVLSGTTLYGTTVRGGTGVSPAGTVFKVNTDGTGFTVLYIFTGGNDGASPYAGLILSGNTLYGAAEYGGSSREGTVFKVNTNGTGFTVLHSFTGGSDGDQPLGSLVLSGNTLYGPASGGGSGGQGTVFALSLPQTTPTISWIPTYGTIIYGTLLDWTELNATASVPGVFAYIPLAGTVLDAGTNTLSMVFTPTDTVNYRSVTSSAPIIVLRAPLTVTASNASRVYGTTNPVFNGMITGIQNSDNITGTYASTATISSPVGAYPIVPSLVDPNHRLGNYMVTTNIGTLTVAPPGGMVDWWPAEGNVNDFVGPNNGTPVGGLSFGPGKVGLTFQFDGATSYINIGASNIPPPWTASFWVNRQDAPGSSAALLASPVVSMNGCALKLEQFDGTRKVGFTQYGVADYVFDYSAPTGTWVHLVFVGAATSTSLYANGVFQGSIAVGITLPRTCLGGAFSSSGAPMDRVLGSVDEVSLFNRALSVSEINALYSAGNAGQYVGPVLPTVAITPATLTAAYGWTAAFTANATGVPPLSYQWLFNGTNLLGATTASLAIVNAQADDGGSYQAIVSNAYGSVTSAVATLRVLGFPLALQYEFQADIDGRDWLIIQGQTVQWQHFDYTPVGLHNTNYQATLISSSVNGSPLMSGVSWIPTWPNGTGFGALSSTYGTLIPVVPANPTSVNLNVVSGRGSVRIVQLPAAANTNTLIIEFNDDVFGGDALYDVQINVLPTTTPAILSLLLSSNSNAVITWTSISNSVYRVQYKTSMAMTNWISLTPDVTAMGSKASFIDHPASAQQRYYRIALLP